jgi:hypothetical protein
VLRCKAGPARDGEQRRKGYRHDVSEVEHMKLGQQHNCRVFVLPALAVLLLACPALGADSTPSSIQSPELRASLIKQLEDAKKADWEAALDPSVSPVRQETFLNQMNKAERVSKELTHGFTASQSEIDDALWMPPKHLSDAERAQLIQQLQLAREQDDRNEQAMLNDETWTNSAEPAETAPFDSRKARIDRVVKDLKIGAAVHWSDIHRALVVVPSPY